MTETKSDDLTNPWVDVWINRLNQMKRGSEEKSGIVIEMVVVMMEKCSGDGSWDWYRSRRKRIGNVEEQHKHFDIQDVKGLLWIVYSYGRLKIGWTDEDEKGDFWKNHN